MLPPPDRSTPNRISPLSIYLKVPELCPFAYQGKRRNAKITK
jgi:hypothetical protein